MEKEYAVEFKNITKSFYGLKANDDISFKVEKGTIHALIGENGAGKSTLMSILFGLYEPTEGEIKVNGKEVYVKNPFEASEIGIGMVHQHFKLVDAYTNLENIVLGNELETEFKFLDQKNAAIKIKALQEKYGLEFSLNEKTENATVATQQKVEIMKMLYRDADILIFDEPTAVLTEQEIQGLLKIMLKFKEAGKTIIFISHKLKEIKQVCDEATVIRLGKVTKKFPTLKGVDFQDISKAMVGANVEMIKNDNSKFGSNVILKLENVSTKGIKHLDDVSFEVHAGEIFAIAGIENNGQEDIEFLVTGLKKAKSGSIQKFVAKKNKFVELTKMDVKSIKKQGLSYIPGDRHKYGLVLDFNVNDNSILRSLYDKKTKKWGFIKNSFKKNLTKEIIQNFDVRGSRDGVAIARDLSGGNQQKAIVGREILTPHDLLVVVQPTRGLDVGAINNIHSYILEEKAKGKAILLISYELDEIFSLADTIAVINKGKIEAIRPKEKFTREIIGLMMSGSHKSKEQQ
ncbi:ABC transporter ATP-binding protein [Candidatus Mycoplasma pogonae]